MENNKSNIAHINEAGKSIKNIVFLIIIMTILTAFAIFIIINSQFNLEALKIGYSLLGIFDLCAIIFMLISIYKAATHLEKVK